MKIKHRQAMDKYHEAMHLQVQANYLFKEAYEIEKEILQSFTFINDNEHTKAVIHLSCASMAYEAKEYTEAKRLCQEGLEIVSKEVLKDSNYFKNEFEKLLKEIKKNG